MSIYEIQTSFDVMVSDAPSPVDRVVQVDGILNNPFGLTQVSFNNNVGLFGAIGAHRGSFCTTLTTDPALGESFELIRGIGWLSFGDHKVQPRNDADRRTPLVRLPKARVTREALATASRSGRAIWSTA